MLRATGGDCDYDCLGVSRGKAQYWRSKLLGAHPEAYTVVGDIKRLRPKQRSHWNGQSSCYGKPILVFRTPWLFAF
eukprot:g27726.t1